MKVKHIDLGVDVTGCPKEEYCVVFEFENPDDVNESFSKYRFSDWRKTANTLLLLDYGFLKGFRPKLVFSLYRAKYNMGSRYLLEVFDIRIVFEADNTTPSRLLDLLEAIDRTVGASEISNIHVETIGRDAFDQPVLRFSIAANIASYATKDVLSIIDADKLRISVPSLILIDGIESFERILAPSIMEEYGWDSIYNRYDIGAYCTNKFHRIDEDLYAKSILANYNNILTHLSLLSHSSDKYYLLWYSQDPTFEIKYINKKYRNLHT